MNVISYILVVYLLSSHPLDLKQQITTTRIIEAECTSAVEYSMKMPNKIMSACYRITRSFVNTLKIERYDYKIDSWVSVDRIDTKE